jgi:hypothetical protein
MQELLRTACIAVVVAAWWIGVAAILYSLVELIAVAAFVPFTFATGKALVRIAEPLVVRPAALPSKGTTPHAAFRLIDPKRCLFREWGPGLLLSRIAGLFFLKGTIELSGSQALVTGRLAFGPSVLYTALLTGWTAGALGVALQHGWPAAGAAFLFLLFGWALLGLLAVSSIRLAKHHFHRAYAEVRGALQPMMRL